MFDRLYEQITTHIIKQKRVVIREDILDIGSVNIRNQIRKLVICILPNQKYGGYP